MFSYFRLVIYFYLIEVVPSTFQAWIHRGYWGGDTRGQNVGTTYRSLKICQFHHMIHFQYGPSGLSQNKKGLGNLPRGATLSTSGGFTVYLHEKCQWSRMFESGYTARLVGAIWHYHHLDWLFWFGILQITVWAASPHQGVVRQEQPGKLRMRKVPPCHLQGQLWIPRSPKTPAVSRWPSVRAQDSLSNNSCISRHGSWPLVLSVFEIACSLVFTRGGTGSEKLPTMLKGYFEPELVEVLLYSILLDHLLGV